MAHYKKRPKVKRYRRSFYSREMKLKKGIGIAVLVLAVLGIGWLAAPHVLDWATHTWYTVVRNRDLSASGRLGGSQQHGRVGSGGFFRGGAGACTGTGTHPRHRHCGGQLGGSGCDHPDR